MARIGETTGRIEEVIGDWLAPSGRRGEVDKGRIRAFGLSNQSARGCAEWLRLAEAGHGPRAASVRNEYSLMCRLFDTDLA